MLLRGKKKEKKKKKRLPSIYFFLKNVNKLAALGVTDVIV